jgi:catechol 2,3-dioxygenase-like lactoylglutathione lyase family enzyme
VTKDLEATRHFYEDILGLPLIATWCEKDFLFGKDRTYCHCFFGIGDGGALAFFQFADADDQAQFGPEMPATPFVHSRSTSTRRPRPSSRGGSRRRARGDLHARARLLPLGLRGRSRTG